MGAMSDLVYPTLPTRIWPIQRDSVWVKPDTETAKYSGREFVLQSETFPRTGYKFSYSALNAAQVNTLADFFDYHRASGETFLFDDPEDNTVGGPYEVSAGLVDSSWWAPGVSLPGGWTRSGTAAENSFVSGAAPNGASDVLWRCTSEDPYEPSADGGWDASLPAIWRDKTYRFMVPVKKVTGSTGSVYWGFYGSDGGANPYFTVPPLSALEAGVWHWMVGYVYPLGSTWLTNSNAGTFSSKTGNSVHAGENWRWDESTPAAHRAYLYYSETGAQVDFGKPLIHLVDGNEPSTELIIKGNRPIIGIGNGAQTQFQLSRARSVGSASFLAPVFELNGSPSIYVNGVLQTSGYTVSNKGLLTFSAAPASGALISWTGKFFHRVRFDMGELSRSQFTHQLHSARSISLLTVKP